MEEEFFIGIDIGTSVSKGVLLASNGEVLTSFGINHQYQNGNDYSSVWWEECKTIIHHLTSNERIRESIHSITITAMVPNLIFLDEDGKSIIKTRLFTDSFATSLQKEMDQADGTKWKNETISKLIKVKDESKNWNKVKHVMSTHSFIGYKLTGVIVCDCISAFEYGHVFDESIQKWNQYILKDNGIDVNLFPQIVPPLTSIGTLLPEIALELDLPSSVIVNAGSHDSIASMIGAGLVNKNDQFIYYGTFNCSAVITSSMESILLGKVSNNPVIWTSSIPDAGPLLTKMCDLTTESENSFNRFEELVSQSSPGANGVIFFQHWNLLNTSIDSTSDAGIHHITQKTTLADICRSVYEAFPYAIKYFYEDAQLDVPANCFVAGGGTRSKNWLQIVSDILNVCQFKLDNAETAVGSALIGLAAYDYDLFLEVQHKRIDNAIKVYPHNDSLGVYKKQYNEYKSILDKLKTDL